jgi:putative endonuclease
MLASKRNGTLALRVYQHKSDSGSEFTARYRVHTLVWYEHYSDVNEAIACEKQLKEWRRRWKLELIEAFNPDWSDLYERLNQ